MSKGWNYVAGDWRLTCDVCGKKLKASHSRHRWDGLIVCDEDFEHRHSMDFIKTKQDKISVPFTRPKAPDVFSSVTYIDDYIDANYTTNDGDYWSSPPAI
jgi:hypothetical protein